MTRTGASSFCFLTLWLGATLVATPISARAQEDTEVDRWRTELELGFNGSSGNSSFSILRTGGKLTFLETDKAEFEATVLVRYGKNEEDVIADDQRATVKLDLWPRARWSPFLFADGSRDEVRNLDAKVSSGAGAKLALWQGDRGRADFSGAALVDYERYRLEEGSTEEAAETFARLSFRFRFERSVGTNARFRHQTRYLPVWNETGDYVVEVVSSLSTTILGNLALGIEHEYLHDSVPPPGARSDDQKFAVTLKVTL